MSESEIHAWLTGLVIALAVVTFVLLVFVPAPYGRHTRAGWGPGLPNALAWVIMELPATVLFAFVYLRGDNSLGFVPLLLFSMWQVHYVNRTFVFPFRLRTHGKRMALVVIVLGFAFNSLNAYVNARWISHLGTYDLSWVLDPRFFLGVGVFFTGMAINLRADAVLIALRSPGETDYKIPEGWLFEHVSSPNYFGEIVEWLGWALATWSMPGLAFAIYTASNVGPRAFANRRWYRETFDDYPADRKALIPFIL
ncbi:DUF1295 domain-containing protein [bacterium]|nr:DUF1295 domain-containing protein [bacterium]